MTSIIYIGMDVHTTNYTICAFTMEGQKAFAQTTINPEFGELEKYLTTLNTQLGGSCHFVCGYEAGCLGYSLYHQIMKHNWKSFEAECIILAPTTMPRSSKDAVKTDKRDAKKIAQCLTYGTYSKVYIPTDEDNAVKEYIRMRDDAQKLLKQTKQQIIALCTRHGCYFEGSANWPQTHIAWLRSLRFPQAVLQEALDEYLTTCTQLSEKLERLDRRIAEMAQNDRYAEKVRKLGCFKGIAIHTALSCVVEIGDFKRFPSAQQFSAFLGLVPTEHSSGDSQHRGGITKAGNSHLRRLLIESASAFNKGSVGQKSKALRKRQEGNTCETIAYADRANERLRRKYLRITFRSKANIAKTAVARELSCFIWGMMTGNIT